MIDKIDRLLGGEDEVPTCRWLAKDDETNPFIVEGYDCASFVSSMVSATSDQRIAETFVTLRSSSGNENVGLLPERPIEVVTSLSYPHDEPVADGPVFKASEMEQKWDIYLYDDRLYFCRSWTGVLMYVAEFMLADSSLRVSRVWISGDLGKGDEYAIRKLDYLIKSHLYGRKVPHPLPDDLAPDPEQVAQYSFSQYGNMCSFGTFEDTLPPDLTKADFDALHSWPEFIQ